MRSTSVAVFFLVLISSAFLRLTEGALLFHNRLNHNCIIVGNYLYIDGGEISTWNGTGNGIFSSSQCAQYDGADCPGNITTIADNNTYSIDLTSSWTNDTVTINTIKKAAPVLKGAALWVDVGNKTFYSYGGTSGGPGADWDPPPNELWRFTPGSNSGSWSEISLAPQSENFTNLVRTVGSGTTSGRGLGFSLGGVESLPNSVYNQSGSLPIPGLVVYNTSSQVWYNVSALDQSTAQSTGLYYDGAAHFVPSFGPEGLLFVIAGEVPQAGLSPNLANTLLETGTVSMYEPVSRQWKTQVVTGSPPAPCLQPCIAGAQGDNGTYEIFTYGGFVGGEIDSTIGLGSVYVLSLPSFHWQQTSYVPQYGRYGHVCNVVNRHMISVGGEVVSQEGYDENGDLMPYTITDPWPQGLGVFDVTEMKWKDSYDAAAGPYSTSAMVKQYYASNPRYPSSLLNDPVLRTWFMRDTDSNTTAPGTSSTPKPVASKSHTAAIAGGVVGGVIGLALTIGVVWWFLGQRPQKPKSQSDRPSSEYRKAELEDTENRGFHRRWARQPLAEAGGSPVYEVEASRPTHLIGGPKKQIT